jgi:hypothetical protein
VAATPFELRFADFREEHGELLDSDAELRGRVAALGAALDGLRAATQRFAAVADAAALAACRASVRVGLAAARAGVGAAERSLARAREGVRLALPSLGSVLARRGCACFLGLVQRAWPPLPALADGASAEPRGRTLFVPDDAAFLGSLASWEAECWGLHVLEVPLLLKDCFSCPRQLVQPANPDPRCALCFKTGLDGKPTVWVGAPSLHFPVAVSVNYVVSSSSSSCPSPCPSSFNASIVFPLCTILLCLPPLLHR